MTRINCKEKGCQHNCDLKCLKESIKVSKGAFCHSFDDKSRYDNMYNDDIDLEFARELSDRNMVNHFVYCDSASCSYNRNQLCIKDKIDIEKKDFGARCVDYQER